MWAIENEDSLGGATCLNNYDITGDGAMELLIGRDDGTVQIYSFNIADDPVQIYKQVWAYL